MLLYLLQLKNLRNEKAVMSRGFPATKNLKRKMLTYFLLQPKPLGMRKWIIYFNVNLYIKL